MIQGKISRLVAGALFAAGLLAVVPSCVDDHFDVQDGGGIGQNATKTLWEQLSSNPDLSNFASIVQKTPAFKDEKHQIQDYTFKDVLSGTQTLTVFAPDNDAFTAEDVRVYDSILQVRPYDVYLRLVGNLVARNRFVATGTNPSGEAEELVLINNKKATFDREAKAFKGIKLKNADDPACNGKDYNIPATNGVLHKMSQQPQFTYNVYEYIRANATRFRHLNAWLEQHDTLYFNSNLSAEAGSNPETGEPIYVDSVYSRYNSLYQYSYQPSSVEWVMPHKGVAANLENEDSIWAMVLPTDAAWEAAKNEMLTWYDYADQYYDKTREDALAKNNSTSKKNMLMSLTDSVKTLAVVQDEAISMDLVSPLVFNVRTQKRTAEQSNFWTIDDFLTKQITKLTNTRDDTFAIDSLATQNVKPLIFANQQPVSVSNGIVFPVDQWNFNKSFGYKDIEIQASSFNIFQIVRHNLTAQEKKQTDKYDYNSQYETYSFNSSTSKLVNDSLLGAVTKNSFMTFYADPELPKVEFKIIDRERGHQVFSNVPYDVYIVMVPDFYRYDPDSIIVATQGRTPFQKNHISVRISRIDERGNETKTDEMKFDYDGQRVEAKYAGTVTFPKSYRNIAKSYPTITISAGAVKRAEQAEYQTTFSIDRILLKAREE